MQRGSATQITNQIILGMIKQTREHKNTTILEQKQNQFLFSHLLPSLLTLHVLKREEKEKVREYYA